MPDSLATFAPLIAALLAGGLIGLERNYHGRAAGFRTHALVCMASCLLMLFATRPDAWLGATAQTIRFDPTRMAQGIMTGIGFLGAGVIYKEDFDVRGLTTAAAIWTVAAIGVLIGVGYWIPAVFAGLLTLTLLSIFRRFESRLPAQAYAHCDVTFDRHHAMTEADLRTLLARHGYTLVKTGYRIDSDKDHFTFEMVLQTMHPEQATGLAEALRDRPDVRGLAMTPAGS